MRARPVRPLPSTNGWIVSNCAWAIAACATAGSESSLTNAHRSVEQLLDVIGGRGDERGRARVEAAPADPVLHGTDPAGVLAQGESVEEALVHLRGGRRP